MAAANVDANLTDDEIPGLMCDAPVPMYELVWEFKTKSDHYCRALHHIRDFTKWLTRKSEEMLPVLLEAHRPMFNQQIAEFHQMKRDLKNEMRRARGLALSWIRKEEREEITEEGLAGLEVELHVVEFRLAAARRKLRQRDALVQAMIRFYTVN